MVPVTEAVFSEQKSQVSLGFSLSANQAPNWQVGRAGSTWTVHRCSAVLGKLFYEPRGAVVLIRGKGGA